MLEIGSVIDGRFDILQEIGRGGMSVVYLARDHRLNQQWAIKEIRKDGQSKAKDAELMKKLDHPALPRIVDIIDESDTILVIMDYIEGRSLDKVLVEYGAQSEEDVLEWAKQICDALGYLHSKKPPIIYRDMKPANVMLKPDGNIKIIDFGIAREYKNLADTTVLGTKGFAPPEQYAGQSDPRSDIYALGMTMHNLLTGRDPNNGEEYQSVRHWNSNLSEGIELIVDRCVQLSPENRYQNCADLLYDLEHPDLITKGFKKKQRRKLRIFLATAILCILSLISGFACHATAEKLNNSTYEAYINTISSPESYEKAIAIYPSDTRAYLKLLETYEDSGRFGPTESGQLLALYNANKESFDVTSAAVAELNYKVGMMYFNYYTLEDGSSSFSDRIQKAYPFFQVNWENELLTESFDQKMLSDCYYQICNFYKKYIFNSASVEEASQEQYTTLMEMIWNTLTTVESAGTYDQLSFYNGTFMLLYDQRASMLSVHVPQEKVLDLLEEVYQRTQSVSVNKEQSKQLQNEILEHYQPYREAIVRTYTNGEAR